MLCASWCRFADLLAHTRPLQVHAAQRPRLQWQHVTNASLTRDLEHVIHMRAGKMLCQSTENISNNKYVWGQSLFIGSLGSFCMPYSNNHEVNLQSARLHPRMTRGDRLATERQERLSIIENQKDRTLLRVAFYRAFSISLKLRCFITSRARAALNTFVCHSMHLLVQSYASRLPRPQAIRFASLTYICASRYAYMAERS